MNPENPNNQNSENEYSQEQWDVLIARAQKAYDRVMEEPDRLSSFSRIARNLINPATPDTLNIFRGDDAAFDDAKISLDKLDKYFDLIDNNPELAEAEKNNPLGMFPEIFDSGITDSMLIVDEIEKRLNQNNE